MKKLIDPSSMVIEETALQLAANYYEIGRSSGLTSKYRNARLFAKHNFEKFIPKALEYLLQMLGRPDIPETQKELIYKAVMERQGNPELAFLDAHGPNPFDTKH